MKSKKPTVYRAKKPIYTEWIYITPLGLDRALKSHQYRVSKSLTDSLTANFFTSKAITRIKVGTVYKVKGEIDIKDGKPAQVRYDPQTITPTMDLPPIGTVTEMMAIADSREKQRKALRDSRKKTWLSALEPVRRAYARSSPNARAQLLASAVAYITKGDQRGHKT